MAVFKDPDKLAAHIKKAMDAALFETIKKSQADLGSDQTSPYKSGRFRSSWFAAEGSPSSETAPEGTDSPNTDATGLRVDANKTYHLTNSLVYAQSVAIEGKVVSQPKNWFIDFINASIPKIQEAAVRVAKRKFDL